MPRGLIPARGRPRPRPMVTNCHLPEQIVGFVEGEHINVLRTALQSRRLKSISQMTESRRDHGKPGESYVYFRVLLRNESVNTMAFNSVGSALTLYKTRMVFHTNIWTGSQGGYVCDRDGMGEINNTPFSQAAQLAAFAAITRLDRTARGNAEVGIYDSVSMADLQCAWCIFPFTKDRIERNLNISSSSGISGPSPMQQAVSNYRALTRYLPNVEQKAAVPGGCWIKFSPR